MTDKTEAPELKPCPFCGGSPTVNVWTPQDGQHRDYGRNAWIVTIKSELVAIVGSSGVSQQDAYEKAALKWNTRADTCAEVKPLEWVQESDFHCHEIFVAKTFFGQYSAFDPVELNAGFYIELEDCALDVSEGPYADMEEAKRACQSDVNTKMEGITTRPASEVHQEGYDAGKAAGRAEALEEVAKWHDEVAAHDQSGMDYSDAVGVPISNYAHLKLNVKAHEYSSKYIRALNKEQGE